MSAIPEDSVLRRHHLADIARRQAVGESAAAPSQQPAQAAQQTEKPSGGILGFIKRLFGG